jgi:oligoribonuclease (3'-5' exoribonuclease)
MSKEITNKVKTPIADVFREWEKSASHKELQDFCDTMNTLAYCQRKYTKKQNKTK